MDYYVPVRSDDVTERALRVSAATGDPAAMNNLSVLLTRRDSPGDAVEGFAWLFQAAQLGHVPAMRELSGVMKEKGNHTQAELWATKAADATIC